MKFDLHSVAVLVNCPTLLVRFARLQQYGLIAESADQSEFLRTCQGDLSIDRANIDRTNSGRANRWCHNHWVNHHSVNHRWVIRVM